MVESRLNPSPFAGPHYCGFGATRYLYKTPLMTPSSLRAPASPLVRPLPRR